MKVKVFIAVAVMSLGLASPSFGASKSKELPVWRYIDKAGEVVKLCDNHNLIYRAGGKGSYGKSIFVIPNGC